MLRYLLTALPVIMLCMVLQASFAARSLRYYARFREARHGQSQWLDTMMLSVVMLLTLVGNFIQMAIWRRCSCCWISSTISVPRCTTPASTS